MSTSRRRARRAELKKTLEKELQQDLDRANELEKNFDDLQLATGEVASASSSSIASVATSELKNLAAKTFSDVDRAARAFGAISGSPTGNATGGFIDFVGSLFRGEPSFRYYGNYGGPNWSGGRRFRGGEPIGPAALSVAPVDFLDSLYRAHDIRYSRAALKDTKEQRIAALKAADRALIRGISDGIDSGKISGLTAKIAGEASLQAFRIKLATGSYSDPSLDVSRREDWDKFYTLELGETLADEAYYDDDDTDEPLPPIQLSMNADGDVADQNPDSLPAEVVVDIIEEPVESQTALLEELAQIRRILEAELDGDIDE